MQFWNELWDFRIFLRSAIFPTKAAAARIAAVVKHFFGCVLTVQILDLFWGAPAQVLQQRSSPKFEAAVWFSEFWRVQSRLPSSELSQKFFLGNKQQNWMTVHFWTWSRVLPAHSLSFWSIQNNLNFAAAEVEVSPFYTTRVWLLTPWLTETDNPIFDKVKVFNIILTLSFITAFTWFSGGMV